ncbi:MAG: pyruvate kinase [Syntrophothermus sp.]
MEERRDSAMKRTKIVCTIGPASQNVETLVKLVQRGMDVARLNFSHGSYEEHAARIAAVREAARRVGKRIAILLDIQGPKIRTGEMRGGKVPLQAGQMYALTTQPCVGDEERAHVPYPPLTRDLKPGHTIYLDDGLLEMQVMEVQPPEVHCKVVVGGELGSHKGVILSGVSVDLPACTEKDIADIRFGVSQDVDFVAASFVREAVNVEEVRRIIQEAGGQQQIIAKIESDEGVRNIDGIIEAANGIMVARGDLGIGIPPEEVPLVQKMIIARCNAAGKPVITATQMLESMVHNPRPTRAEVTDVANAILDGTDAVMLSGESTVGKYPVETVHMMAKIAVHTESSINYEMNFRKRRVPTGLSVADAISHATCQTVYDLGIAAVITSTQSGSTARMISKYRPKVPIVAATPDERVARQLALMWGVYPVVVPQTKNIDEMLDVSVEAALASGLVSRGDLVAITAGVRTGEPGSTNLLKVHQIV